MENEIQKPSIPNKLKNAAAVGLIAATGTAAINEKPASANPITTPGISAEPFKKPAEQQNGGLPGPLDEPEYQEQADATGGTPAPKE